MNGKECNAQSSKHIEALKKLTALLDFSQLAGLGSGDKKNYEVRTLEGKSTMFGLYKKPEIAIARAIFEKNTRLSSHHHDQWEAFIIVSGRCDITLLGKTFHLKAPSVFYVEPRTLHELFCPEETSMILVTIPASPDFPIGGN